jgi:hypothetical protein
MPNIHFQWQKSPLRKFASGVSLHSHTLHSRESLDFIGRVTSKTPWLSGAIRKQREKYRALKGREVDLTRAWWTPPLSAHQAWELERSQIAGLGLHPMISISDHDNIDAALSLRVLDEARECPISVEWTVPFGRTFFHIGIHNMPAGIAIEMMDSMLVFTKRPLESAIGPLLEWLGAAPESLVIFNHPLWDENHIGQDAHAAEVEAFLERFGGLIHAFELNGLRPWKENRAVVGLAERHRMPLVSGGDRHGKEPNACLNLTNAVSFAEFADEVRRDRWSDVLFLHQYCEPLRMRILDNMAGIIEDDPEHALGWVRWSDRVFYLTDEGVVKSLAELWGSQTPAVVTRFVGLMSLLKHRQVRGALRAAFAEREEFAV